MDKSILTVTTPTDCVNCVLCHRLDLDQFVCQPEGKAVPVKEKPEWCPLRPMPKKVTGMLDDGSFVDGADYGWNECIEALEGSEGDN